MIEKSWIEKEPRPMIKFKIDTAKTVLAGKRSTNILSMV